MAGGPLWGSAIVVDYTPHQYTSNGVRRAKRPLHLLSRFKALRGPQKPSEALTGLLAYGLVGFFQ